MNPMTITGWLNRFSQLDRLTGGDYLRPPRSI